MFARDRPGRGARAGATRAGEVHRRAERGAAARHLGDAPLPLGEPEGAPPAEALRGHRGAALPDPGDGRRARRRSARGAASPSRPTATPATATSTATSCSIGADERPRSTWPSAEMLRAAVDLGGTITGEHGVGFAKRDFLEYEQGAEVVALERRLKAVFDPLGNPESRENLPRLSGRV